MPDIKVVAKASPDTFKKALSKLSSDSVFREKVKTKPETLTTEFNLSVQELRALRQAAILSGVDMAKINTARLEAIRKGAAPNSWDIDISCCCCCCCGETAVVRVFA